MADAVNSATRRLRALDAFCGDGGMGMGLHRAGFEVEGVDNKAARVARYPFKAHKADAVEFILEHGHEYDYIHAGPTCTGYSRGTAAIPDRLIRYDRLIAVTREALLMVGKPYTIENVEDAGAELRNPILLCGRTFGLHATDDDGTYLVLDRHRLFESNLLLLAPPHEKHDRSVQVAGVYGGARSDKHAARNIRHGGYTPKSARVQNELLGGVEWMTGVGRRLCVPPVYGEFVGSQVIQHLTAVAA